MADKFIPKRFMTDIVRPYGPFALLSEFFLAYFIWKRTEKNISENFNNKKIRFSMIFISFLALIFGSLHLFILCPRNAEFLVWDSLAYHAFTAPFLGYNYVKELIEVHPFTSRVENIKELEGIEGYPLLDFPELDSEGKSWLLGNDKEKEKEIPWNIVVLTHESWSVGRHLREIDRIVNFSHPLMQNC